MNYSKIKIDISEDDNIKECNASCKLSLRNTQNTTNLSANSESKISYDNKTDCNIHFGLIPLYTEEFKDIQKINYNVRNIKIIYNPNIKIDNKTKLLNTKLFIYLLVQNNSINKNLHFYIPIINGNSNNREISKLLNNENNSSLDNLYENVFPETHSFYYIKLKDNLNSIILFDTHKVVNEHDYYKIRDILGKHEESFTINIDNIYYSLKRNCLNNDIDFSNELLKKTLNQEQLSNFEDFKEKLDQNYTPEMKDENESMKFKPGRLIVNLIMIIFLFPLIFSSVIKFVKNDTLGTYKLTFIFIILFTILFTSITMLIKNKNLFYDYLSYFDTSYFSFILIALLLKYVIYRKSNDIPDGISKFFGRSSLLIIVILVTFFFSNWTTKLTNYIFDSKVEWTTYLYYPLYLLIFVLLRYLIYGHFRHSNSSETIVVWAICSVLFLFTDPGNFIKSIGDIGLYSNSKGDYYQWSFTILRYAILVFLMVFSTTDIEITLKQSFNFEKLTLGDEDSRNKILKGVMIGLLTMALSLNVHKLNQSTYIKEVIIEKTTTFTNNFKNIKNRFLSSDTNQVNPSYNPYYEEYNNKFDTTNIEDFKDITYDNSKDDETKLIIYYYNNDNIINKIKFLLDDNTLKKQYSEDKDNLSKYKIDVKITRFYDKEQNLIEDGYNNSVIIVFKFILLVLTVISFFIKSFKFNMFLFIMLLIFFSYSLFGLYYSYDNKLSHTVSGIISIIYLIIIIVRVFLTSSNHGINISIKKYYSNIYLYIILILITGFILLIFSKVTNSLSFIVPQSNIFIYIILFFIIFLSTLFYFTSIRGLSEERISHVSSNNENKTFQQMIKKEKENLKKKEQTALEKQIKNKQNMLNKSALSIDDNNTSNFKVSDTSKQRNQKAKQDKEQKDKEQHKDQQHKNKAKAEREKKKQEDKEKFNELKSQKKKSSTFKNLRENRKLQESKNKQLERTNSNLEKENSLKKQTEFKNQVQKADKAISNLKNKMNQRAYSKDYAKNLYESILKALSRNPTQQELRNSIQPKINKFKQATKNDNNFRKPALTSIQNKYPAYSRQLNLH